MTTQENMAEENIAIAPDYAALCEQVAGRIAELVWAKPDAVLGLATGATPLGVYDILARRHQDEGLDFARVTCFNLDEYYPMPPDSPNSYYQFMRRHLFDHINCRRWSVPDGRARPADEVDAGCRAYESAIRDAGGIDFQLLGIGRTGHVGFNEPGSRADSRTQLITLHPVTREDAAGEFGGLERVPTQAVSMGLGTILEAREIVLMAHGPGKADIVQQALTGAGTEQVPASLLRRHPHVRWWLDREAAGLRGG